MDKDIIEKVNYCAEDDAFIIEMRQFLVKLHKYLKINKNENNNNLIEN